MENSLAGEATAAVRRGEVVSTDPLAFGSVPLPVARCYPKGAHGQNGNYGRGALGSTLFDLSGLAAGANGSHSRRDRGSASVGAALFVARPCPAVAA